MRDGARYPHRRARRVERVRIVAESVDVLGEHAEDMASLGAEGSRQKAGQEIRLPNALIPRLAQSQMHEAEGVEIRVVEHEDSASEFYREQQLTLALAYLGDDSHGWGVTRSG